MQRLEIDPGAADANVTALAVGEELVLEIPENGTTGYTWTVAVEPSGSVRTTGSEFVSRVNKLRGAAGVRRFAFVAYAAGEVTIELQLSRSWESGPARERAVVQVTVREPEAPQV